MATQLDLQEQEQLDALKAFWKQYGNLITWLLVIVLGGFAGWNFWQKLQRDKAQEANALFTLFDEAARAGDVEKTGRVFNDLKERFPRTAFAEQAALEAAKVQFEKGQADAAKATLTWAADNAVEEEYRTVARLRLAGILIDAKQYDEALKQLDAAKAPGFEAMVADRRGDALAASGKKDAARTAYQDAFKAMDEKFEYRRLVEAKLTALGATPPAAASAAASGASK